MADTGTFVDGANYSSGDAAGFSTGLMNYGDLNAKLGAPLLDAQYGMVAAAGGGWTNATQIRARSVEVATVATGADSVKLPPAIAGTVVHLANAGASSMQVFGYANGDTINGTDAYVTGVAQANAKYATYFCPKNGVWYRVLTA